MTTSSWSTVVDQSTDAGFRAQGSEMNGKMTAAGLVQAADTGQINWVTVTRPAAGAIAGYEIWRFADSTIYFKLEYGSGGAQTQPRNFITVGTGSNGSGTITGQTSTRTAWVFGATIGSTSTAYASYLCVTADFFGIAWKAQGSTNALPLGWTAIDKFVDSTGAATTDGFVVYYKNGADNVNGLITYEPVKTSSPAMTYGASTAFCLVPALITTSAVGADNQIFLHMTPTTPLIRPVKSVVSVLNSELALSTTFTATPVGATSHTFISLNNQVGRGNSASTAHAVGIAMLWE